MPLFHLRRLAVLAGTLGLAVTLAGAQSVGNSGSVTGTVTDSTGAVVAGAKVQIHNPVSGFDRSTTTDNAGDIRVHKYSLQPLPPERDGCRVHGLRAGCRTAIVGTGQLWL